MSTMLMPTWNAFLAMRPCESGVAAAWRIWPAWPEEGVPPTVAEVLLRDPQTYAETGYQRWIAARILGRNGRTPWARACADRARGYAKAAAADAADAAAAAAADAAAAYARTASADAVYAANLAYCAAEGAYNAAGYADAYGTEHRLAMEHAVNLLEGVTP